MKAYKITDKDGCCRGFQYEVGKTYKHDGEIKMCDSGFHACRQPMDCLSYQDLYQSRFFKVTMGGNIIHGGDKSVCSKITIDRELTLKEYIDACWNSISAEVGDTSDGSSKLAASGDSSRLAASGDSSQLAASGNSSKLAASGYYSKLAASGNSSQLAASGYSSQLAASGDYSKLAASGDYSKLAASGNHSVVAGIAPHCRAKIEHKSSWLVIADWAGGKPRKVVAKKPGQKLDGITIKTGHWYWYENGLLREEKDTPDCDEESQ